MGLSHDRSFILLRQGFSQKFTDEAIDVYQGTVSIIAIFPQGALSPTARLRGTLLTQACTDEICLPPAEIALRE
jgi:hypothetical protein